jgi:tRNA (mo5U34)-methyltransferase
MERPHAAGPAGNGTLSDDAIRRRIATFDKWFVHTNFGNGIVARSTCWPDQPDDSRHAGVSKFEFIVKRNLPDLQGKRILELGCNAGVISIHMSRLGAREVIAVDCDRYWPRWQEQAEFLKQVLEWRCQTTYNVQYIDCDMRRIPALNLGRFDAVIALNCLYYLEPVAIGDLMRELSDLTDHLVVQCNTRDHRSLRPRNGPAFMADALRNNGFPRVTIDWPWDLPRRGILPQRYSRPVVVGRKNA